MNEGHVSDILKSKPLPSLQQVFHQRLIEAHARIHRHIVDVSPGTLPPILVAPLLDALAVRLQRAQGIHFEQLARKYSHLRHFTPALLAALRLWAFPPHARCWTRYGEALRVPSGLIHWAGAESSAVWMNYMDGAVRSGERAAAEVIAALR